MMCNTQNKVSKEKDCIDKIIKKFTHNSKAEKLYRPRKGYSASGKCNGGMVTITFVHPGLKK